MNPSGPMQPELRMVPAHERLERQRRAALQRHLRLVVDDQLAALDPAAELRRQREPVDAVLVILLGVRVEGGVGVLGAVHRDVGVADQLGRGAAVLREAGDADAGADVQRHRVDLERIVERGEQLLGHGLRPVLTAVDQHRELVAADPRQHGLVPDRLAAAAARPAGASGRRARGRACR